MVAPGQSVLSLAGYASMVTLGLRMNWLFVGLKSPTLLFLLETLPRIGGLAIAASGLLWLGWGSVAALYVVAASNALSMPLTLLWARARHTFRGLRLRTVRALASAHWHGVVGLTTSALWSTAPTYAVAWLAPSALPAFALAMRVYAQANTASSPAIDVLQGWVPADDYATTRKRAMRALAVSAVLAAIGFGIYFLVAPYLFAFLGAGQVVISPVEQLLLGVALVLSVIVQTTNRACLAALGLAGRFSAIVVIGSLSGLCALFLLIPALGAVGGLLAVITSLLVQAVLGVYITVRPPRSVAGRQRTAQP
jgi:O-antigen/teichoic acid export membrane protein